MGGSNKAESIHHYYNANFSDDILQRSGIHHHPQCLRQWCYPRPHRHRQHQQPLQVCDLMSNFIIILPSLLCFCHVMSVWLRQGVIFISLTVRSHVFTHYLLVSFVDKRTDKTVMSPINVAVSHPQYFLAPFVLQNKSYCTILYY